MNNYLTLKSVVKNVLSPSENQWVQDKLQVLEEDKALKKNKIIFSLVARKISEQKLILSEDLKQALIKIDPSFLNKNWNKQELVRALVMLSIPKEKNKEVLTDLFESAAMQEQVSFFKALYLLENAKVFTKIVEEGIRTNMVNVFDSFALYNPFAVTYLEDWAWNQLILKLFFLDRPLYLVYEVDTRKTEALANMLQDYVKERWAAHREISPEIWRLVKGYLREDVKQLMANKTFTGVEKQAIDFVLQEESLPRKESIEFWNAIGLQYQSIKIN